MSNEPVGKGSRRDFVIKLAYVAPAILTLAVAPSFAKPGSCHSEDQDGDSNCQGQQ